MSYFDRQDMLRCDEVRRIEVVGNDGRLFVGYFERGAVIVLQDDGKTLKVFVGEQDHL